MGKIVFVWDNFGPLHADRCDAVAEKFAGRRDVFGIELASKSRLYSWVSEEGARFKKVTLVNGRAIEEIPFPERFTKTLRTALSMGRDADFFICHYQDPAIFLVASLLRLLGRRVYAIGCSKFDDSPRFLRMELVKSIFYRPYNGGIGSGKRSRDYMRFLGLNAERIQIPYNVVSLDRIRKLAGAPPAPQGAAFHDRHFSMVARLIPEKNFPMVLNAMALYAAQASNPRHLHIFGDGPLEESLREQARQSGIENLVHFRGFLQTAEISRAYASSLALLLPSLSETYGNVVPEALAMGLPVILSDQCGARDLLVRSGINGFVIEPDNPIGLAYFMQLISKDESQWRRMCLASQEFAERADSQRFAEAVDSLVSMAR